MSAIERIQTRLGDYPDLKYQISPGTITIEQPSPDGFSVSLVEDETEWTVLFDGWHGHFDSEEEALNCFVFGLSNECRLEITSRGDFPYRWVVQQQTDDGWKFDSSVGLLLFPFWRKKHVAYRQNNILDDR